MTPEKVVALPEVPTSLEDVHGHPRFGTWQGELPEVALHRLKGTYQLPRPLRLLKQKRWSYVQIVTPDVIAVMATADLGYTSNAFVAAYDLKSRTMIYDAGFLGLPGTRVGVSREPGAGHEAWFKRPGTRFEIRRRRHEDPYQVRVELGSPVPLMDTAARWAGFDAALLKSRWPDGWISTGAKVLGVDGGFSLQAKLATTQAGPALTVIAPVAKDGVVNVTQKRCGLPVRGTLRVGKQNWSLDGGLGGQDYTHGYLARNTAWRWAMANGKLPDGTRIGLNLVEGFNEQNPRCSENALWVGDRLIPLGRARFHFDRLAPERPWTVETADGTVGLRFQPLHLHREERDYKLVRSHFVQPLGLFSGTIRVDGGTVEVKDLAGVTEDQDILW